MVVVASARAGIHACALACDMEAVRGCLYCSYVVLGVGIRNRRIASHSLNQRSSRGHCMLTVHVDSMPAGAGPPSRPSTGGNNASGDGLATCVASRRCFPHAPLPRSHGVPMLHCASSPHSRYGRFTFVDLAGSERLGESNSKGKTAHETGHINKSLFNLGKVRCGVRWGGGAVRPRKCSHDRVPHSCL